MPYRHILTLVLCGFLAQAWAAEPTAAADPRRLVEMPAAAQALMRQDMLSHLAAVNAIVAALGKGDLNTAADTAEQQLGRATMGRYRGTGMGPGRFMPGEMRDIGLRMHDAADAFATTARQGDALKAYAALEPVTTSCVTCHATYRTR
jgi:hypothetical protein